jgi:hypothetical protein
MTNLNDLIAQRAKILQKVMEGVYDKNPTQFENDMEVYYSFQKLSPKTRSLIHNLAYQIGHEYGYSEIFNHYPELVELAWCAKANG